jgi:hypothetical protein
MFSIHRMGSILVIVGTDVHEPTLAIALHFAAPHFQDLHIHTVTMYLCAPADIQEGAPGRYLQSFPCRRTSKFRNFKISNPYFRWFLGTIYLKRFVVFWDEGTP